MHLLFIPSLATPLTKVPVLMTCGILSYSAFNVPYDTPKPDQRKVRADSDFYSEGLSFKMLLARGLGALLCGVAFTEGVVILAQSFPSLPLSQAALSVLLPDAQPRSLSLAITPRFIVGSALSIFGGLVRAWSYRTLGRFFTVELCTQKDHKLMTTGPYAYVRHPSYTGWMTLMVGDLLALLGSGTYLGEIGAWQSTAGRVPISIVTAFTFATIVVAFIRTGREDEMLRKEFGAEWDEWAKRTPYRLIPYIF